MAIESAVYQLLWSYKYIYIFIIVTIVWQLQIQVLLLNIFGQHFQQFFIFRKTFFGMN